MLSNKPIWLDLLIKVHLYRFTKSVTKSPKGGASMIKKRPRRPFLHGWCENFIMLASTSDTCRWKKLRWWNKKWGLMVWPTYSNRSTHPPSLLKNCTNLLHKNVWKRFPDDFEPIAEKLMRKKKKANSTWCSQAVTHPSTNQAQRCLTSVIGRELVLSTWYGRWRETLGIEAIWKDENDRKEDSRIWFETLIYSVLGEMTSMMNALLI